MSTRAGRSAIAASAVGALAILGSFAAPVPARAALDPAVLEAIESPEVAAAAQAIAALLDGVGADADAEQIAAALHGYLSEGVYAEDVVQSALDVVLGGEWSDVQLAALRNIFSEFAPENVEAPSGGGMPKPPGEPDGLNAASVEAPEETALETSALEQPETGSRTSGFMGPPPPPSGSGGSDYSRR